MTQFMKTSSRRRLAKKPPSSEAADTEQKGRRQRLIIASLVITVIAVVVGVGYYLIYVAPFQQTTLVVDDVSINMRYFLKRTYLANQDPETMLWNLTNELVIKQAAPQQPYNIKVTTEDIDEGLMGIARGENETISDSEFREWYRQQLNESGLSDTEYRDLMYTTLLKVGLYMYLGEREPTETMHFYLHAIFLDSYEDALAIRARWEAGEDFADLAREVSTNAVSAENSGEIGWLAYKTLGDDTLKKTIIDLDVGEVSQPVAIDQTETETGEVEVTYALIMFSDKAIREMDEETLAIAQSNAFNDWLLNERRFHKVLAYGRDGAGNWGSKTIAWINWQLQEMAK